ncbi:MAG: nitroreductase family protein [Eggerthellaceae bacterium]|jgi:nitroreductase
MEFMDVIKGRRSIRRFTNEPIPREKLEYIMEAALWAPSGQNLQPWYFVVLNNDEDIKYVVDVLGTSAFSHRKKLEKRFKNNPEVVEDTMNFERALGGSHCIVMAFLHKQYSEEDLPSCIESVAAAMENLVLAAYEQGIASCWIEAVRRGEKEFCERFAPGKGGLVGAAILGYPAMEARPIKRKEGRIDWRD